MGGDGTNRHTALVEKLNRLLNQAAAAQEIVNHAMHIIMHEAPDQAGRNPGNDSGDEIDRPKQIDPPHILGNSHGHQRADPYQQWYDQHGVRGGVHQRFLKHRLLKDHLIIL
jgi:hypothetical protein